MFADFRLYDVDYTVKLLTYTLSLDDFLIFPKAYITNVQATLEMLIQQEDTNKDGQITIEDQGPKIFGLRSSSSDGFRTFYVHGNYALSNLLQRLVYEDENGRKWSILQSSNLTENPVDRLSRLIRTSFLENLTRTLDKSSIHIAAPDAKGSAGNSQARIYVPEGALEQLAYYQTLAVQKPDLNLDVCLLPTDLTNEVYREIVKKPGLLALEMRKTLNPATGEIELCGLPFVVPGGRFNELYNWDSYFMALGLLADKKVEYLRDLVMNFIFEVQHYGLVPNANRSYYLLRSQPPFLTDLALRTYRLMSTTSTSEAKALLFRATCAAMKEYHKVWMRAPRLDDHTGLSRYRPAGIGSPPECSLSHFAGILRPFAAKYELSDDLPEFRKRYDAGQIVEPDLDEYFLHDRSVRESGHDVSLRVENLSADLASIDLNCLLYKYEKDIAYILRTFFEDEIHVPEMFLVDGMRSVETSSLWDRRSIKRKLAIDKYLWNEEEGTYFDYNTTTQKQTRFETVTSFWALWCGVASPYQAARLVSGLGKFESVGGLVSTTVDLRGTTSCHDAHQWDYPYGWAPHQVMAWDGLRNYGYYDDAERLTYRWLFLITKVFVEFNGAVVEKYDVTQLVDPHRVDVDYGNQGLDFKGYAKEG